MINLEYLKEPINLKVFFAKVPNEPSITFNHYGVIAKETLPNNFVRLIKNNGQEALLNMANVNQIITL